MWDWFTVCLKLSLSSNGFGTEEKKRNYVLLCKTIKVDIGCKQKIFRGEINFSYEKMI